MMASWKRGFPAILSTAVVALLLAAFAVGCGDSEPTPTSTTTDATAPPGVRTAQPTLTASGAPPQTTAAAPADEPMATPVPPAPKPPGYLHGAEHGIALLQTTRTPSGTREGWVDITLILATLKFAGDVDDRDHEVDENSLCYLNSQPPHDCLFVAWGNEEQFEAEISASHLSEEGLHYKTDLLFIEFEVAANATNASLFFGEQHKIPLNVQGDEVQVAANAEPAPAPVPSSSSGKSTGYFIGADYGIAITGVRRESFPYGIEDVLEKFPGIFLAVVDISVLLLREDEALGPVVEVDLDENVCFGSGSSSECLAIRWGTDEQFESAPVLGYYTDTDVEWPRGKGLPQSIAFIVPNVVDQATLEFGQHRIPIDLRGMTGDAPVWDYKLHYPELQVGSILYDSNNKTVVLDEVRQEEESGDVTLVFSTTNNSEATDFAPVIELAGSRVSESGTVFDKFLDRVEGWTPHTIRIEAGAVPPGGSSDLEVHIPRSKSSGWNWIPFTSAEEDRPDAAVFQIEFTDSLSDANPQVSAPVHALFERRNQEHALFEHRNQAEKILFTSHRGGNWEIFAMNPDGSGVIQLTDHNDDDKFAFWLPDGGRIAFQSDSAGGDWDIYAMNSDGSGVIQLTYTSSNDASPAWSPDGRRIAFVSDRDGDWEIYAMNSDGSSGIQLTHNSANDELPAWSPDRSRIAFVSDRDGDKEIYTMNSDGSGVIQLTHNSANDEFPAWSPDSRRIAFASNRDGGNWKIYTMNSDGSGVIQLTDNSFGGFPTDWALVVVE